MSSQKTLSGQLPLMQVSEQHPGQSRDQIADPTTFRLSFHTFTDVRTYSVAPLNSSEQSPNVAQDGVSQISHSPYKRISFTSGNVPGQPKRKKRRSTQNPEKAKIRTLKPLSSSVRMHADAWYIILAHTRPSFVMQMRTVSKFFYGITNTDTIWRDAREYFYGADMPPRPACLTERQYATLLDGRGCQNPQCERRETRKVRWVFRLRLCDDCLARKLEVYKPDASPSPQSRYASLFQIPAEREQWGTSIVDLLPTSGTWSGKPSGPRSVMKETGKWLSRSSSNSPLLYLKSDYAALDAEYKRIQEEDWEPERVVEWVREKYCWATTIAKAAGEIEWWELQMSGNLDSDPTSNRTRRKNFFVQRALELDPPIREEVLNCFAAYHASLASSNHPTERAWETLLPKILPYRSQAERVEKYWSTRGPRYGVSSSPGAEMDLFDQLHEQRRTRRKEIGRWSDEQKLVLDIGEAEFDKLMDVVADEDLLLLCLRNVYTTYQQTYIKPHALSFDGSRGEYKLSLDDAKLVVEEVIEKKIKKSTLRGVKVLESLRCMGCTRFTSGKRYSFQSAFEHILEKHGRRVGKDLHFHRFLRFSKIPMDGLSKDFRFPWYLVEWTKSLPILPTHAEVTSETRWDPDEDIPYVQSSKPNSRSAFDGRRTVPQLHILPDDFTGNFVHAVKILSKTRLEAECIVKIAIRYSTERSGKKELTLEDFFACIKPTQELGTGIGFKFRCGACNHRPDVNSHLRCVKHSVDISTLRKHWDDKHVHERIDWTTNFMDLPSDTELLETMIAQDQKLRLDQATSMERETIGLRKSAKKVRDQKATALMQKEMAMAAFSRLFVQEGSSFCSINRILN